LQRLARGPLIDAAPEGAEVWLDGGHNPHGAAALARAMADFEERAEKPLYLICGMLRTKDAVGFLSAFRGLARHIVTVDIPGEEASLAPAPCTIARVPAGLDAAPPRTWKTHVADRGANADRAARFRHRASSSAARFYLAGQVLAANS